VKHIVNVSGGNSSGICLFRVAHRFRETIKTGEDEIFARFADTRSEDADTYRFIDDLERVSGIRIDRLSDGRNCWDVWFDSYMFHAVNGCRAAWELKKKQLDKHLKTIVKDGEPYCVYLGFNHDEDERVARIQANRDTNFDFPLRWQPHLSRCELSAELRTLGIEPPRLYASGYNHNNCGGACILAGISQWSGLLKDNPELFRTYERNEQLFLDGLRQRGRKEHTILRDRRGGQTNNYSLQQLRQDIESGNRLPNDKWRESSCQCFAMLL
jgi:hypothetical protein